MSLAHLVQTSQELRRLSIAGSPLAHGDFRLQRLVEPLRQSGAKAPVFAKVADALDALLSSSREDSARSLLKAATLVNAVLYTQGRTGAEGEWAALPDGGPAPAEQASLRTLRPVMEALRSTGAGRWEVITEAFEGGVFKDLRLLPAAVDGLSDAYAELADFVADRILPTYGRHVLPLVQSRLTLKGDRVDARRLRVIGHVCGQAAWDTYFDALENGSAAVRIAAIRCLAPYDEAVPLLTEQTKARNGEVRAAALEALGSRGGKSIVALFIQALTGKDAQRVVGPIRATRGHDMDSALIAEAERQLQAALLTDPLTDDVLQRLHSAMECFRGRHSPASLAFLRRVLKDHARVGRLKVAGAYVDGDTLVSLAAEELLAAAEPNGLALIADLHGGPAHLLPLSVSAAVQCWPAARVFETFEPMLRAGKWGRKHDALTQALANHLDPACADPRWLDSATALQSVDLLVALARPDHPASRNALEDLLRTANDFGVQRIFDALFRIGHPDLGPLYCRTVRRLIKQRPNWHWWGFWSLIPQLPTTAIPELETLAAELPDRAALEMADQLAILSRHADTR